MLFPQSCCALLLVLLFALLVLAGGTDPSLQAANGRVVAPFGTSESAIRKLLVQHDGKIIGAGRGRVVNSFGDFAVVRFNQDGSLDTSFDGDGKVGYTIGTQSSTLLGAALQADGKIVLGGEAFGGSATGNDFALMRINPDGSLDTNFGNNGKVLTAFNANSIEYVTSLVIQGDGKILAAGTSNGQFALARYNPDGTPDTSFGTGGRLTIALGDRGNVAYAVALQADGKIVTAGSASFQSGGDKIGIARFNPDGTPDISFDGDGRALIQIGSYAVARDLVIQPDGSLVAVGLNYFSDSVVNFAAVRLNADGSLDPSFGNNGTASTPIAVGNGGAYSVSVQEDGKFVLAGYGYPESVTNGQDGVVVRYNADGTIDTTFATVGILRVSTGTSDTINSVIAQNDGNLLFGGVSAGLATTSHMSVARYTATGIPDPNFGQRVPGRTATVVNGIIDEAFAVAVQPDKKIILAGRSRISNRYAFSLTRQNPDGTLDPSFGSAGTQISKIGVGDTDSEIRSIDLQADGKIVAAGRLYDANNASQSKYSFLIARYNTDGTLDTGFGDNGSKSIVTSIQYEEAFAIKVQPDGKIVVAGRADINPDIGIVSYDMMLVRLNPDGSPDLSFDGDGILTVDLGGSSDSGNALAIQPDGKILVGGLGIGVGLDFALLRYNADGTPDVSFGNNGKILHTIGTSNDECYSIKLQPDGKILAGGYALVAGNKDYALARLNTDGSLDNSFNITGKIITSIAANAADTATSLVLQPNGKVLLSGTSVVQVSQSMTNSNVAIVRYNSNGLVDTSFGANGIITVDYSALGNSGESALASTSQSDGKLLVAGTIRDSNLLGISGDRKDFLLVRVLVDFSTPFDYDGDGKSDLSVFRPSDNNWFMLRSTDGFTGYAWGLTGDKIAPADFDGDGKTDVAVWRPSDGKWYVIYSDDFTISESGWGLDGDIPVPGDYDGDGTDDLAVFRPSENKWYIRNSGGTFSTTEFGLSGDKPVVGDFDGDGRNDLVVYHPSNNVWYLLRTTAGFTGFQWGLPGDLIAPADYDGDGSMDVAVWRPSEGRWYWINSSDLSLNSRGWGLNGDVPVPADYDGDGKADQAVFRPSESKWYFFNSSSGISELPFGLAGDKPTQTAFIQ